MVFLQPCAKPGYPGHNPMPTQLHCSQCQSYLAGTNPAMPLRTSGLAGSGSAEEIPEGFPYTQHSYALLAWETGWKMQPQQCVWHGCYWSALGVRSPNVTMNLAVKSSVVPSFSMKLYHYLTAQVAKITRWRDWHSQELFWVARWPARHWHITPEFLEVAGSAVSWSYLYQEHMGSCSLCLPDVNSVGIVPNPPWSTPRRPCRSTVESSWDQKGALRRHRVILRDSKQVFLRITPDQPLEWLMIIRLIRAVRWYLHASFILKLQIAFDRIPLFVITVHSAMQFCGHHLLSKQVLVSESFMMSFNKNRQCWINLNILSWVFMHIHYLQLFISPSLALLCGCAEQHR